MPASVELTVIGGLLMLVLLSVLLKPESSIAGRSGMTGVVGATVSIVTDSGEALVATGSRRRQRPGPRQLKVPFPCVGVVKADPVWYVPLISVPLR